MRPLLVPIPPSRSRRLSRVALGLGLWAASAAGCQVCNDIACGGGFEWNAETADGSGLAAGSYAFDITLDGSRYAVDCTIAATVGQSSCSEPTRVDGDGTFNILFQLSHTGNDWNPEGPADGFHLRAADRSGSDPDGSYSETRGPAQVVVVVQHDGQPFLEAEYAVTYVRDDEYRGDERCGYCDELQTRDFEITP
jgi:hypothetical protein